MFSIKAVASYDLPFKIVLFTILFSFTGFGTGFSEEPPLARIEQIFISEWCCEVQSMKKGTQITVMATGPFDVREYTTHSPPSLVIQMKAVDLANYKKKIEVNIGGVKEIVPKFIDAGDWTGQIRLNLRRVVPYKLRKENNQLIVFLYDMAQEKGDSETPLSPDFSGEEPLVPEDIPVVEKVVAQVSGEPSVVEDPWEGDDSLIEEGPFQNETVLSGGGEPVTGMIEIIDEEGPQDIRQFPIPLLKNNSLTRIEQIFISEWCCEIKTMKEGTQITVMANGPFEFREYTTQSPPSLIIQMKEVDLAEYNSKIVVNTGGVKEIIPRFINGGEWTGEIRLSLRRIVPYKLRKEGHQLIISLYDMNQRMTSSDQSMPPESPGPEKTGLETVAIAEEGTFQIIRMEHERDLTKNKLKKADPDYYINAGSGQGLTPGMILDVYRPQKINDPFLYETYQIQVLIGQLKVQTVFSGLSVARAASWESPRNRPVVIYSMAMIGDHVLVREKSEAHPVLLSLPSTVLFGFDRWELSRAGRRLLKEAAKRLGSSSDHDLVIEGYTCSIGDKEYNETLSMKRARVVADYLVGIKAVRSSQVHTIGHGEAHPKVSNETEEGRRQNRRVDFRLIPRSDRRSEEHVQENIRPEAKKPA